MASLTQTLVDDLTARIQEGVIHPGDKLPTESSLVETYGVSRTVVREAISRLQAAGLVETQHGRGTFVLARPSTTRFEFGQSDELTLDDVVDLLDFRTAFEVEAAALAARRRGGPRLEELLAALDRFAASADNPSAAVNADYQFHLRVALATGNRYFADLITSFGPSMIIVPRDRLSPAGQGHFEQIVVEHENIYAAIERQDSDGARAAARVHLGNSRSRLLAAH
ncbi:FadR/GntR family transcriptional regulator [Nonomuraea guangzhouensis]|uniref:FadR/GntR family transcriptional regulator n=1 Tax=Nonomuraea guangzhouensis TaxID=1291555 RepID=A0ABW4GEX2_9ACTN